jgi:hypothetical protein
LITTRRPLWRATLGTVSASAAALLGALYGLGAVVESIKLANAGVSVADGLSLVPLPDLLTAGIGLLLSTVLAFVGVSLFIGGLYRLEAFLEDEGWRPLLAKRKRRRSTTIMLIHHAVKVEKAEAARLMTLRDRVNRFPQEADQSTTPEARAAMAEVGKNLVEEAQQQQVSQAETLRRLQKWQRHTKWYPRQLKAELTLLRAFLQFVRFGPLAIGTVVGIVAPYPVGAAVFIAGAAWSVATKLKLTYKRLGLSVLVSTSVLLNGLMGVAPLPIAAVRTTDETLRGSLVALTDATWYVGTAPGVIRPVRSDRVQVGIVRSQTAAGPESLWQIVESV